MSASNLLPLLPNAHPKPSAHPFIKPLAMFSHIGDLVIVDPSFYQQVQVCNSLFDAFPIAPLGLGFNFRFYSIQGFGM